MYYMSDKDYCDYDTCVALYELGLSFEYATQKFDRNILSNRYEEIPRPLIYETQKWLREEKNLAVYPFLLNNGNWVSMCRDLRYGFNIDIATPQFDLYEDSLLNGIKEVVKYMVAGKYEE